MTSSLPWLLFPEHWSHVKTDVPANRECIHREFANMRIVLLLLYPMLYLFSGVITIQAVLNAESTNVGLR